MSHFRVQNGRFGPNKQFLGKIFNIIFIYLLTQDYEDAPFLGPKGANFPNGNFSENLLINLVPIIQLYLHSKNQSDIWIY